MKFLTREDVSMILKINIRTVDKLIRLGYLDSIRIGDLVRITQDSFDKMVEVKKKGDYIQKEMDKAEEVHG
jgi:hypothetical protein